MCFSSCSRIKIKRLGIWTAVFTLSSYTTRKAVHMAYRFLPSAFGVVGGWNGKSDAEICSTLNPSTTAAHWSLPGNDIECKTLVSRKVSGIDAILLLLLCLYVVKRLLDVFPSIVIEKHMDKNLMIGNGRKRKQSYRLRRRLQKVDIVPMSSFSSSENQSSSFSTESDQSSFFTE